MLESSADIICNNKTNGRDEAIGQGKVTSPDWLRPFAPRNIDLAGREPARNLTTIYQKMSAADVML